MMSRRRFMAQTSVAIDQLAGQLALESQGGLRCRHGWPATTGSVAVPLRGLFMLAALLAAFVYIVMTADFSIGAAEAGVAFVIVNSLLGKGFGLVVASVRLEMHRTCPSTSRSTVRSSMVAAESHRQPAHRCSSMSHPDGNQHAFKTTIEATGTSYHNGPAILVATVTNIQS
jgi:hypothetical protein